mgnify:CR=1 FL=1
MATFKDKVQAAAFKAGVQKNTSDSLAWFRKNLRAMKRVNRRQLLKDDDYSLVKRFLPGRVYMFYYDPKGKKELPYYDRFPLVVMVKKAKGGFYGLNLHYLPPILRARLFDALQDFKVGTGQTERLRITYSRLKGASKTRFFKPCFKHYLLAHVKSRFAEVPAPEWEIAAFLPTAQWEKASAGKVYQDSRMKVNG